MEKTNLEVKTNRNVTLDYLRVFAMFMVVFDHIAFMRRPEWIGTKLADYAFFKPLSIIQWSGAFGVCIFFLLTGYLFIPCLTSLKVSFFDISIIIGSLILLNNLSTSKPLKILLYIIS